MTIHPIVEAAVGDIAKALAEKSGAALEVARRDAARLFSYALGTARDMHRQYKPPNSNLLAYAQKDSASLPLSPKLRDILTDIDMRHNVDGPRDHRRWLTRCFSDIGVADATAQQIVDAVIAERAT